MFDLFMFGSHPGGLSDGVKDYWGASQLAHLTRAEKFHKRCAKKGLSDNSTIVKFPLPTYLPTYLPIYLSIYLSINQSINQSIYLSLLQIDMWLI